MLNYLAKIVIILSLISTTACDPALRIEFINQTGQPLNFTLSSTDCDLIYDNLAPTDSLYISVSLDTGYNNNYTEFLGIGGWQEKDIAVMEECLEFVFDSTEATRMDYKITLSEFGSSLMQVSIKDIQPKL